MEFKVFTRGTYFYIIDENDIEYEGFKKDVRVRRLTSNSSEFYFGNINGWTDPKGGVDIANIVKEDGSPYSLAEFIEFKESETGNFNAGGETPQETETNIVAIADGYSYTNESGEVVNITQKRDISDINNQKIETLVNGVKVFEFPLDNSGGSGGGSGKIFTRTQWSRTLVAPLNVNNNVVLNLLNGTTTLRESDKLAAGTDDFDTLSILPNGGVIVPWNGIIMHHTIRVSFEIVSGSDQEYRLELRRVSDNSVIGAAIKLNRNTDFSGCLVDFETYTASSTDPFVTGGFYIALNNVSGQSAQIAITTPINVYINTTYQTLRQI
jgi:hypothetical protein